MFLFKHVGVVRQEGWTGCGLTQCLETPKEKRKNVPGFTLVVDNNRERYQQRSEDTEKGQKIPTKVRKAKEKTFKCHMILRKFRKN